MFSPKSRLTGRKNQITYLLLNISCNFVPLFCFPFLITTGLYVSMGLMLNGTMACLGSQSCIVVFV